MWESSTLVAGCQIGLSRGHARHFKTGNESRVCVCVGACVCLICHRKPTVWFHLICWVGLNLWPAAIKILYNLQARRSRSGRCRRRAPAAAAWPPWKARWLFLFLVLSDSKVEISSVLRWSSRLNYRLKLCLVEFLSNSALKGGGGGTVVQK